MKTAKEFLASKESLDFQFAVEVANRTEPRPNPPITACARQVRKWRKGTGLAYKVGRST
jgi:hypothetical protein